MPLLLLLLACCVYGCGGVRSVEREGCPPATRVYTVWSTIQTVTQSPPTCAASPPAGVP
jgi:hypothetical protein